MAEYIEREAAYPLAKKICDAIDSEDFQRLNFGMRILDWIDDLPAADVRPVVLCRDCKNYIERSGACAYLVVGMREDDFCSYGEKRGES